MSTRVEVDVSYRIRSFRSIITRPADTTQYTAGDVLANAGDNNYFQVGSNAVAYSEKDRATRTNILTGALQSLVLLSSANQSTKPSIRLFVFSKSVSETADNAAFEPTDGEMSNLICTIDMPTDDWVAANPGSGAAGNSFCESQRLDIPFSCAGGVLHIVPVVTNTYTPVSGEVFTLSAVVRVD